MTDKNTLLEKFNQLVRAPLCSADLNDAQESVYPLHQDDWVRILLIRRLENPDNLTIEIESSLPLRVQGEPSIKDGTMLARNLLHGMIRTLQYLLNLEKIGFNLDIIGQDCMWTAYKDFSTHPDAAIFDAITPPLP